jgi:nucleotide-binding universal stress UspA family protein
MKHFLVAFDFSKNAVHSLEYALMFANRIEADLSLVWVDSSNTPEHLYNIDQELRIETKSHFDDIIQQYAPLVHHGKINQFLRKGKVYSEVAAVARAINASLLFAGTHGVSGFEEFWIGSNAYRIVASATCPVITIRRDYEFNSSIKKIVLPIDNSADTRHKIPYAARIAKAFDAEIHLLTVNKSPIQVIRKRMLSYVAEASRFLENEGVKYIVSEVESDNVTSSILTYSEAQHADFIAIMTEQGASNGNMFLGPYAQQLINNAKVPVLSVQSVHSDLS